MSRIHQAFAGDDAPAVRSSLESNPDLRALVNEPIGPFNSPALLNVRSREMLEVLLDAGADINAKSQWWAGGFGLLHTASPELCAYAIQRGARVDAHAAARLGLLDTLAKLVAEDPALVHSRGGDGQTPLHFAANVEVAGFLLDQGADIDARDVDHESTPAQWMVKERQEVARYLVNRGCKTDLLMAAALGDPELVRKLVGADPKSLRLRVSEEHFPMVGCNSGGTIYQWTLGWYVSAHQVAQKFGYPEIFNFLMDASPPEVRLITACWLHNEGQVRTLLAAHPGLVSMLTPSDRANLAHAARNADRIAAKLMLDIGLPVDGESQHGGTALHWAAFHGDAELVKLFLARNPPLETQDPTWKGTPLKWATYGSENGWDVAAGDYAATVKALLHAGAKPPKEPSGSAEVRQVLTAES